MNFHSLKGKEQFKRLFAEGKSYSNNKITLKLLSSFEENQEKNCFWGICVSKNIGGSVIRNRYKRCCRATIQSLPVKISGIHNIAFIPKKGFIHLKHEKRIKNLLDIIKLAPEMEKYLHLN